MRRSSPKHSKGRDLLAGADSLTAYNLLHAQRPFCFPFHEVQHERGMRGQFWSDENPNATTFTASSLNSVRLKIQFSGIGTSVSMFSKKVYSAILLL